MNNNLSIKKAIIVVSIILGVLVFLLICISFYNMLEQSNLKNEINRATINEINVVNETEETGVYLFKYKWNESDVKTYEDTYYVDLGIEETPQTMKYVLLRIETKNGDLMAGTYTFKSRSSYVIYVVDEPIELNNYDGTFEQVINNSIELNLEKGQYVYIVQGSNPTDIITLERNF